MLEKWNTDNSNIPALIRLSVSAEYGVIIEVKKTVILNSCHASWDRPKNNNKFKKMS